MSGASTAPGRLASVDVLRGLTVAAMLLVNNPGDWGHVYPPLAHAAWHGCTPTDLIFPSFLFIVGVSAALALGPRVDAGADIAPLRAAVAWRGLRLIGLGLLLHALAWWCMGKPEFRVMGVLQRIGLCFMVVGGVALHLPLRRQWLLLAGLLAGYALLLAASPTLDKLGSWPQQLDTALLGRFAYEWDPVRRVGFDPEGLLSTLGALASTLLGLVCGQALRAGQVQRLVVVGGLALMAGWGWQGLGLPWNKQLWTPSFVLWTGGWAALALAAAHAWVDRRGHRHVPIGLGRAFGLNAIGAYAGAWICAVVLEATGSMPPLYRTVFGPLEPWVGPEGQSLAFALAFVAVWAVVVTALDRRGWYWKV